MLCRETFLKFCETVNIYKNSDDVNYFRLCVITLRYRNSTPEGIMRGNTSRSLSCAVINL
jgi:hypothetical protein